MLVTLPAESSFTEPGLEKVLLGNLSNQPNRLFMQASPPHPTLTAFNVQAAFTCWINTLYWVANPSARTDRKGRAVTLTQKGALTHELWWNPRAFSPSCPYLLKHLFGSIEFHLVSFETHFQVPNLLSLGFHLVCEDTHLTGEIKQWWRSRTGSPGGRAMKPHTTEGR